MNRVSVVGVGRMGLQVCARLVESGFDVTATDVAPERRADAEAAGARWADATEAARANIVVTVLPGPPEVSAIARPLTEAMAPGTLGWTSARPRRRSPGRWPPRPRGVTSSSSTRPWEAHPTTPGPVVS